MTLAPVFRIRRPDGTVKLDLTKRMFRWLGTVETGTSNGSIDHPGFAQGTPVWRVLPAAADAVGYAPKVTVSGITLSWTFESGYSEAKANSRIRFGVR
ncbi:hypothetical protein M9978_16380 [Sphingomonas sp. MG17]|uniref:Uncharacterized protein n=1 Tax=Sphingomonas tagetis TaxID=2949092 RepID=A0A9X2HR65_9SPHN|nr:hypothetical protein [Sphingomonas tagetis]MCP3732003.1 hypothetical protein [Sphingomonas tagetis]